MAKPFSAPPGNLAKGTPSDLIVAAHAKIAEAKKLQKNGQLARAIAICEALIKDHPTYVAALHLLGNLQMDRKHYWVSLPLFIQAAMLNPRDGRVLTSLSNNYLKLGANKLAAQTIQQAGELGGDDPIFHFTLGQIYRAEHEYELVAESLTRALKIDPSFVWAAYSLGQCLYQQGRMKAAAAALMQALKLNPGFPHVLYLLGQLPASVIDIDLLAAVELARQTNTRMDDEALRCLGLARAAALHRLGRHKEAWDELVEANLGLDLLYAADWENDVRELHDSRRRALETPALHKEKILASDEMPLSLFILGPSRSGKTALERLVKTIDGVKCGYESQVLRGALRQTLQLSEFPTIDRLANLPKLLNRSFLKIYAAELRDRTGDAVAFTSTNPGQIHDAGTIALLIPNSKFIFINRDKNDTVFRIYGKEYKRNKNKYAYNLDRSFYFINWYYEMASIWTKMLPDHTMTVDYEDMIADPAATLARVAQFCGLPMPAAPLPPLGDDRGCSAPYRAFMDAARGASD